MRWNYMQKDIDLSEIVRGTFKNKMQRIRKRLREFEGDYKGRLRKNISETRLRQALDMYSKIREEHNYLDASNTVRSNQDSENDTFHRREMKLCRLDTEIENRTAFFKIWIQRGLNHRDFRQVLKKAGDYRPYLRELRDKRRIAFDEKTEEVIRYKDNSGEDVLKGIYERIWHGSLWYQDIDLGDVISDIYIGQAQDLYNTNVRLMKFKSALAFKAYEDRIPLRTIENLLHACRDNAHVFHRYFSLRGKLSGIKRKLREEDLDRNLLGSRKIVIPYRKAVNLILETFYGFSEEVGRSIENIFEKGHINANQGKDKDPYSVYVSRKVAPYVELQYNRDFESVLNLSHELMHCAHFQLGSRQPYLLADPSYQIAEVMSLFGELLVEDRLRGLSDARHFQKGLMVFQLDNFRKVIHERAYEAMFEIKSKKMINSSEGSNRKELSNMYISLKKELLGKGVTPDKSSDNEWIEAVDFISTPFYKYPYPFGQLGALMLFEQYKEDKERVRDRIVEVMSGGNSDSTEHFMDYLGINIRPRSTWEHGYELVDERVRELRRYTGR